MVKESVQPGLDKRRNVRNTDSLILYAPPVTYKAFEYYNKCLNIRLSTLPENHPAISHKILPPTHREVRKTEENIERIRMK